MKVPSAAISRLITYLRILEELEAKGIHRTSSEQLAEEAQVTAFQVRKDLSYFGSYGTRGVGYTVPVLKRELRHILGLNRRWGLAIVGMGRLGSALADYPGFGETFELRGFFDVDPEKIGKPVGRGVIEPMEALSQRVPGRIEIALLTVPREAAQEAADQLVRAGIKGILNFAPVVLEVPKEVAVENVDFLAGLTRLAFFILNPKWGEEMVG
ncbi:redox-sensing transcriptional repressor Rex [Thermus sp.]|jgi:redox-sensing transcriptional repressor|uniref:redox-sensing transcriptional repressor Rex n=1 Tax=Bacteria TaxID=2 RepID=UPI0028CFD373|nr:redox-sensing transcriptional repressor Rex [Thermus sp.]MDT7910158.1 redox-sensing transcriptional repressor Rex [Thermus sp.]